MRLWQNGLQEYDELVGLDWEWQSLDGVMRIRPLGGGATGPNPTDRAKRGTKRSQLCEGHGLPLAVTVDGANVHDTRLVAPTLNAIVIARPEPSEKLRSICVWMRPIWEEKRKRSSINTSMSRIFGQ